MKIDPNRIDPSLSAKSVAAKADTGSLKDRVELKGTECPAVVSKCKCHGRLSGREEFEVSVILKRPNPLNYRPSAMRSMTRETFEKNYAATPKEIASVREFAQQHGLTVSSVDPITRTVKLKGRARQYEEAFGVKLRSFKGEDGSQFHAYNEKITLPKDVADSVETVIGLQNRPIPGSDRPHRWKPPAGSFKPRDVASLYNFPKGLDGRGQTIAIIALGGAFHKEELEKYFKSQGLPMPDIEFVSVDGARNRSNGKPDGDDGETVMDIEVAASAAPGAKIVVYRAKNTDQGFLDAINAAVHDKKRNPKFVSISWGDPEENWVAGSMKAMNDALQEAATLGVNVFCASGDDLSSDGVKDGKNHMDFPASSPWAISVGGTSIKAKNGRIIDERVWKTDDKTGGGGGFSNFYVRPPWQKGVVPLAPTGKAMRGGPDLSADADPDTGYQLLIDHHHDVSAGTSASTPLTAAMMACVAQGLTGPMGFIAPLIYSDAFKGVFEDIVKGDNGAFKATRGWDAASGIGSPRGDRMLAAMKKYQSSMRRVTAQAA